MASWGRAASTSSQPGRSTSAWEMRAGAGSFSHRLGHRGIDQLGRTLVLLSQPLVGKVQVKPGRLYGAVPGLDLQASRAIPASRRRVKQVSRSSWQLAWARPARALAARTISSRPSSDNGSPVVAPFQHHKDTFGAGMGRPFAAQ